MRTGHVIENNFFAYSLFRYFNFVICIMVCGRSYSRILAGSSPPNFIPIWIRSCPLCWMDIIGTIEHYFLHLICRSPNISCGLLVCRWSCPTVLRWNKHPGIICLSVWSGNIHRMGHKRELGKRVTPLRVNIFAWLSPLCRSKPDLLIYTSSFSSLRFLGILLCHIWGKLLKFYPLNRVGHLSSNKGRTGWSFKSAPTRTRTRIKTDSGLKLKSWYGLYRVTNLGYPHGRDIWYHLHRLSISLRGNVLYPIFVLSLFYLGNIDD